MNFFSLHQLFDQTHEEVEGYADSLRFSRCFSCAGDCPCLVLQSKFSPNVREMA
jgi:hypothetical protein